MPHTFEPLRWLSQSNIDRFELLLAETEDDEKRATLVELLSEERESLKRLESEAASLKRNSPDELSAPSRPV